MIPAAQSNAPILVLAQPDDPVAAAVHRIASSQAVPIWQPTDLSEVGWSATLDHERASIRLIDRCHGRSWDSGELAGIWYQALPPMESIEDLDERDRQYVIAEIRSSLAAVWQFAACPVIGQSRTEETNALLGAGPEARISLQRIGLPAATMVAGIDRIDRLANEPQDLRISSLGDGLSYWHESGGTQAAAFTLDIATAIASDDRTIRVIVFANPEVRSFLMSERGDISEVSLTDQDTHLAVAIHRATRLDLAVAICSRQQGDWRITRLTAQIPWWLTAVVGVGDWLADWLIARCPSATAVNGA